METEFPAVQIIFTRNFTPTTSNGVLTWRRLETRSHCNRNKPYSYSYLVSSPIAPYLICVMEKKSPAVEITLDLNVTWYVLPWLIKLILYAVSFKRGLWKIPNSYFFRDAFFF